MNVLKFCWIFICFLTFNDDVVCEENSILPWWNIHKLFNAIAEKALMRKDMQKILDENFVWWEEELDAQALLLQKKHLLEEIFRQNEQAVNKLVEFIEHYFDQLTVSEPAAHCCDYRELSGTYGGCGNVFNASRGLAANPPGEIISLMKEIISIYQYVNDAYFGFNDGSFYAIQYPMIIEHCDLYDPRTRPWYKMVEQPVSRHLIFFIDTDSLGGRDQIARDLLTSLIHSITPDDQIFFSSKCARHKNPSFDSWWEGISINKNKLVKTIDALKFKNGSEPIKMKKLLKESRKIHIKAEDYYGHLTVSNHEHVVIVVTGGDVQCDDCETPFALTDDASDSERIKILIYSTGSQSTADASCGEVHRIHSRADVSRASKHFHELFTWDAYLKKFPKTDLAKKSRVTIPFPNYYGDNHLITSSCLPIMIKNTFLGVACTETPIQNELENMVQINGVEGSYGFVVDNTGRALLHPLMSDVSWCDNNETCLEPMYEQIQRLERLDKVKDILHSLVDRKNGTKEIDGILVESLGHSSVKSISHPIYIRKKRLMYAWTPLDHGQLSLCLVFPMQNKQVLRIRYKCKNEKDCSNPNFTYHYRADELEKPTCIYFGSEVADQVPTIKFTPNVFKDQVYYRTVQSKRQDPVIIAEERGDSFMNVLKGKDLLPGISLANQIGKLWQTNDMSCLVGLRVFQSADGIVSTYPGSILDAIYDGRDRCWYQVAAVSRQQWPTISLVSPYTDFMSGGKIVSVVLPIEKTLPSGNRFLAGVTAADFSLKFLSSELRRVLPECLRNNTSCLLLDAAGYVISDWQQEESLATHIITVDPEIADTLIEANILVRKACMDLQRSFVYVYWLVTFPDQMSHFTSPRKQSFDIMMIPFMNVFLVVRNYDSKQPFDEEIIDKPCVSSCSLYAESPCYMNSDTKCNKPSQDMRKDIHRMVPCWPSRKNPTFYYSQQECVVHNESLCEPRTHRKCPLWKENCV